MNKLVSKGRKGLSWKEILEERRRQGEKRQNYNIIIFVCALVATIFLVASVAVMIRTKYLQWKRRYSEDTESAWDLFTKEERRMLEERVEKLKKNKDQDEN